MANDTTSERALEGVSMALGDDRNNHTLSYRNYNYLDFPYTSY
jgi:hypothetical protein